jgi:hypothetical protein
MLMAFACVCLAVCVHLGTELERVAADYAMRIASGTVEAYRTLDDALSELASANTSHSVHYSSCPFLNISVCEAVKASSDFTVLLWNSQARPVRSVIRLPVYGLQSGQTLTVRDVSGRVVDRDVLPVQPTAASKLAKNESASNAVAFMAEVEALGYTAYSITVDRLTAAPLTRQRNRRRMEQKRHSDDAQGELVSIESAGVRLTFNTTTGLLSQWTDKLSSTTRAFSQNFYWYESSNTSAVGCSNAYYVRHTIKHSPTHSHHHRLCNVATSMLIRIHPCLCVCVRSPSM